MPSDLVEGLFGIFMTFVVLAGAFGMAWGMAHLIGRQPKCSACGWREGHRTDCKILDRLVELDMARERRIIGYVQAGKMDIEQARKLLQW